MGKCHGGESNESNEKEGGARAGPRGHESNEKEAEGNESSEEEVNRPRKDAENVLRPPNVQTMYHICFNKTCFSRHNALLADEQSVLTCVSARNQVDSSGAE